MGTVRPVWLAQRPSSSKCTCASDGGCGAGRSSVTCPPGPGVARRFLLLAFRTPRRPHLGPSKSPSGTFHHLCLPSTTQERGPGCQDANAIIRNTRVRAVVEVRTTTTTPENPTQSLLIRSSDRGMKRTMLPTLAHRAVRVQLSGTPLRTTTRRHPTCPAKSQMLPRADARLGTRRARTMTTAATIATPATRPRCFVIASGCRLFSRFPSCSGRNTSRICSATTRRSSLVRA